MKLEWKFILQGKTSSVSWENGVLSGHPTVVAEAEYWASKSPPQEVEIWWGMWFDAADLSKPETAWGTVRYALHHLVAEILEQPDPPFEPPLDDGIVY